MQEMQQIMGQMQQELMQEKQGNSVKLAELKAKTDLANREFQADLMRMKQERDQKAREAMLAAAFERWKAHLEARTTVEVARIQAAAKPKEKAA
jgi:hypothetical protein